MIGWEQSRDVEVLREVIIILVRADRDYEVLVKKCASFICDKTRVMISIFKLTPYFPFV